MCVSVCNVSSVYERDSVCVSVCIVSSVYERDSVCVCASVCIVLSVYERDSVCVSVCALVLFSGSVRTSGITLIPVIQTQTCWRITSRC